MKKQLTQEEYDVYSAVIAHQWELFNKLSFGNPVPDPPIAVYYHTTKGNLLLPSDTNHPMMKYYAKKDINEIAVNFSNVSSDTVELDQSRITQPFKLIDGRNIADAPNYSYSMGVSEFSRVGFNMKADRAVVYADMWIEWGGKNLYLLQKDDGKWKVVDVLMRQAYKVLWENEYYNILLHIGKQRSNSTPTRSNKDTVSTKSN